MGAAGRGYNIGNCKKQAASRLVAAEALELRAKGLTLAQVAKELGLSSPQAASKLIQSSLRKIIEEPAAQLVKMETARLDMLWREAIKVMDSYHIVISNGQAVMDPRYVLEIEALEGEEGQLGAIPSEALLRDTGPVLAAIDRLLKIQERRARLLGLDAPKKMELGGPDGGPIPITEVRRVIIDPADSNS